MQRHALARRPPSISVRALTQQIKGLLEGRFQRVWVEGELAELKEHQSGNIYFTLKDADARIAGVIWRSTAQRIQMFGGYQPTDGHRVLALGSLSIYAPRGTYSLVVERFLPAGTGDLQAAFERLKKTLAAEGLFDRGRKRRPPMVPRAVGVVTSPTGAARHDIQTVLHRRSPQIPIVLYPALVQGPGAAEDVIAGLRTLAADPRVDVIIVGRGGGSIEDLWTFNEEAVARAIAECPVPIISAVGHETDTTIADLVADVRAATPSEAAEKAVPNRADLLYALDGLSERLTRAMTRALERRRMRLIGLRQRLMPGVGFGDRARLLERMQVRLDRAIARHVDRDSARLRRVERALREQHPVTRIARARRDLDGSGRRLEIGMQRRLRIDRGRLDDLVERLDRTGDAIARDKRATLSLLATRLHALSPIASLARGFSITRRDGRVIRSAEAVTLGERIEILLHRGRLEAEVCAVHPETEEEPR